VNAASPAPWSLAEYIRMSPWAYPSLEVVHLVGLGLVFGTLWLVELRLLGIGRRLEVGALAGVNATLLHTRGALDPERPAGLSSRSVPAQQAAVDTARILAEAQPPPRSGLWTCELAPLTRLAAWQAPQPRVGDRVAVVGFTKPGAPELRMRAEFVFIGDRACPLRSAPA
jgi:hypothetical protein